MLKSKLRIFILGLAVPSLIVYGLYVAGLAYENQKLFARNGMAFNYSRAFRDGRIDKDHPPLSVVVLGDSTGNASVAPLFFKKKYMVNLALPLGTAITSYIAMENVLAQGPAPKCFLMIHQYNWEHGYGHFFDSTVFFRGLNFKELTDVWDIGSANDLWPANSFNRFSFFFQAARARLRIDKLRLDSLREALISPSFNLGGEQHDVQQRMYEGRGYLLFFKTILPEDRFFIDDIYKFYLGDFSANKTEDFYLHKMSRLAKAHGSKFFFGIIPAAESDFVDKTAKFRADRDAHIQELFRDDPDVTLLDWPKTLPRDLYFNFTHLNVRGAIYFKTHMADKIYKLCGKQI